MMLQIKNLNKINLIIIRMFIQKNNNYKMKKIFKQMKTK